MNTNFPRYSQNIKSSYCVDKKLAVEWILVSLILPGQIKKMSSRSFNYRPYAIQYSSFINVFNQKTNPAKPYRQAVIPSLATHSETLHLDPIHPLFLSSVCNLYTLPAYPRFQGPSSFVPNVSIHHRFQTSPLTHDRTLRYHSEHTSFFQCRWTRNYSSLSVHPTTLWYLSRNVQEGIVVRGSFGSLW